MTAPEEAARFWLRCARHQLRNLAGLSRTLLVRYEDLADDREETLERILRFVPELERLDGTALLQARNVTGRSIRGFRNLNEQKILALEPGAKDAIRRVLREDEDVVSALGYSA